MRLLGALQAAWRLTSDVSAAVDAARAAYAAGEPAAGIVRAWARSTGTSVDDGLVEHLIAYATQAIAWAERAALVCVQVALRLEMQAPPLVARFVATVDWLESRVPPLLARARAAADRAERGALWLRGVTQRASVALTRAAVEIGRLKGDA